MAVKAARRTQPPDGALLIVVGLLSLLGFLMILSASAPAAQFQLRDGLYFFRKQLFWGLLGAVALVLGMATSLDRLRGLSKVALLGSAGLVLLTYVPHIGTSALGASRWLRLGPLSVQPSELLKLTLVFFLADLLTRRSGEPWSPADYRRALLPVGGALGLVLFQPDLGTTLILALSAFVVFFLSGTPLLTLAVWATTGAAGGFFHVMHTAYQRDRWLAYQDPWKHPRDIGFQLIQSLLAIGSGGVFGTGWGQGKQKLFYLPIQHTDFIFAVLAEELGLVGGVLVLVLFAILAQRGYSIARYAPQPFQQLLAAGLTTVVVSQALINIGVVTASLPTTGIPLPFVSFGGTSLLVTLFSVGLILNVSRQARVNLKVVPERVDAARTGAER